MRRIPPSASIAPFPIEQFGRRVGTGNESMVRALPILGREKDWVVKINHHRGPTTVQETENGLRYKKEKYEILKLFLGDFIPDTGFVLGKIVEGIRTRPVGYVVQQRLPNRYLGSLTPEQREDPRLVANMQLLMIKMESMYKAIGYVNAVTGGGAASLDAKLDLGGISGYVREHIDDEFTPKTAQDAIRRKRNTPNILVDPDSMDIWCIDFDKGEWTDEKAVAKEMLFSMVESRVEIQDVIRLQVGDFAHPSAQPNGSHAAA